MKIAMTVIFQKMTGATITVQKWQVGRVKKTIICRAIVLMLVGMGLKIQKKMRVVTTETAFQMTDAQHNAFKRMDFCAEEAAPIQWMFAIKDQ